MSEMSRDDLVARQEQRDAQILAEQEKALEDYLDNHPMKGNKYWMLASRSLGKNRAIKTADELLKRCVEYLESLDSTDDQLTEAKLASFQGDHQIVNLPKMKAGTIKGLCLHVGIDERTWKTYRSEHHEYRSICLFAQNALYERKINGSAAGLLNPSIIARELGLADRTELTGRDGGPVNMIQDTMTPQEAAEAYASTLNPDQD